jgi:hypothetical protein
MTFLSERTQYIVVSYCINPTLPQPGEIKMMKTIKRSAVSRVSGEE